MKFMKYISAFTNFLFAAMFLCQATPASAGCPDFTGTYDCGLRGPYWSNTPKIVAPLIVKIQNTCDKLSITQNSKEGERRAYSLEQGLFVDVGTTQKVALNARQECITKKTGSTRSEKEADQQAIVDIYTNFCSSGFFKNDQLFIELQRYRLAAEGVPGREHIEILKKFSFSKTSKGELLIRWIDYGTEGVSPDPKAFTSTCKPVR